MSFFFNNETKIFCSWQPLNTLSWQELLGLCALMEMTVEDKGTSREQGTMLDSINLDGLDVVQE